MDPNGSKNREEEKISSEIFELRVDCQNHGHEKNCGAILRCPNGSKNREEEKISSEIFAVRGVYQNHEMEKNASVFFYSRRFIRT